MTSPVFGIEWRHWWNSVQTFNWSKRIRKWSFQHSNPQWHRRLPFEKLYWRELEVGHCPNPIGKCIVLSLSIQLFQLLWVEIYSQKMIFPFLILRYYILLCPTPFNSPISCTYFYYGPLEPQSQSIWQTHLHYKEFVTEYYFLIYFK